MRRLPVMGSVSRKKVRDSGAEETGHLAVAPGSIPRS